MGKRYFILLPLIAILLLSTGTVYNAGTGGKAAFAEENLNNKPADAGDTGNTDMTKESLGPSGTGKEPGETVTGPAAGETGTGTNPGGASNPSVATEPSAQTDPTANTGHAVQTEPTPTPEPEPVDFTIVAVGDVVLGRGVGNRLDQQGRSFEYPFEKVRDLLIQGDIVFFNLETPITDSTHSLYAYPNGKYILKTPTKFIESIKYAGFNMANLANNHMMDFYERGLDDTMALLDEAGIVYSGAGRNLEEARKPAMMEVKGLKTAMLGYTDMAELVFAGEPYFEFVARENKHGVAPRKMEYILEDVGKIRDSVDLVIVSLHWGVEETFTITKEMVEFAHTLIDSGVDIILGHHPHQFQGMEIYNGKPIIYSMGNFIMDQNDPENQEGFILIFQYRDTEFINLKAIPVRTEEKTQVVLQEGEGALNILQREKRLCEELGTVFEIVDGNLVYEME
jgi:poly-gamma-glutamate capsule biosynthesis protein CapA/YwtB (metallophosphatase superfamily)